MYFTKSSRAKLLLIVIVSLMLGFSMMVSSFTSTSAYAKPNNKGQVSAITPTVDDLPDVVYTGKEIKPTITVRNGDAVLVEGTDYTSSVTYENNINVGTAKVTITFSGGCTGTVVKTFNITKMAATLTTNSNEKVYGEADPPLGATVTGVAEGDQLNYTLSREEGEGVGDHQVIATLGDNPNYDVTVNNTGYIEIRPKDASITTTDFSKTYGDGDSGWGAIVLGTVNGDVLNFTLYRDEGEDVGEYTIYADLGDNPNYFVTVNNTGKCTINKRSVTLTTNNASKTYGDADPEFTATVDGLVGSDTLNYTLSREQGEDVGQYKIIATIGDNPNYAVLAYNSGVLTINPQSAMPTSLTTETDSAVTYTEGTEGTSDTDKTSKTSKTSSDNIAATADEAPMAPLTAGAAFAAVLAAGAAFIRRRVDEE